MTLKDELQKLIELQTIDVQLYALSQEKDFDGPAQLKKLQADFDTKKKTLNDAIEIVKQAQLKKKNKELDLATREESIQKAQASLNQLKTNKEYQAKMQEIASLKADVALLDEEVLKSMESIESAEKIKKEAEAALSNDEKIFNEACSVIKKKIADCDVQMQILNDKRTVISRDVDKKVLMAYDRLLKSRAGVAITSINTETSSCGACYMNLTAQTINEAKMLRDLVFCQSCNRILYIPEVPKE